MEEEDCVIKWWLDYLEKDILERREMVDKLPYFNQTLELMKVPDNDLSKTQKKHITTTMLCSFFDDCIETCDYVNRKKSEKHE